MGNLTKRGGSVVDCRSGQAPPSVRACGTGVPEETSDGSQRGTGSGGSRPLREDRPVIVRPGTGADAAAAARLHADGITQGFLSFLGPGFLTRLYRRIVRDRGRRSCWWPTTAVPWSGSSPARPTSAASTGPSSSTTELAAGAAAAPRLVRSWRRVLETLRHGAGASGTGRGTELLAVAVDPAHGGRGVGRALVEAFLDRGGRVRGRIGLRRGRGRQRRSGRPLPCLPGSRSTDRVRTARRHPLPRHAVDRRTPHERGRRGRRGLRGEPGPRPPWPSPSPTVRASSTGPGH